MYIEPIVVSLECKISVFLDVNKKVEFKPGLSESETGLNQFETNIKLG